MFHYFKTKNVLMCNNSAIERNNNDFPVFCQALKKYTGTYQGIINGGSASVARRRRASPSQRPPEGRRRRKKCDICANMRLKTK